MAESKDIAKIIQLAYNISQIVLWLFVLISQLPEDRSVISISTWLDVGNWYKGHYWE